MHSDSMFFLIPHRHFYPCRIYTTPTNYVFTVPGDEIIISLYGETQFAHDLVVSNNRINMLHVGVVDVNGLIPGALKTKLFNRLAAVYSH